MNCPKCGGAMSFETFVSTSSESAPWSFEGWRCVYCGDIIDPLVVLNRMKTETAASVEVPAKRKVRV